MSRKQRSPEELSEDQRMRDSDLQTALLRVVDGTNKVTSPLDKRTLMQDPGPWNEVGRGEMPYTPWAKLLKMLRDATRAGRLHATKEKQELMRENVHAFFAAMERYALEELSVEEETEVIPLLLEETKVTARADEAEDLAKIQQSPENLRRVGEEMERQAVVSNRLKDVCFRAAARARFYTPRTNKLFQVER